MNKTVQPFILCCGIQYPINSIEEPLVISPLMAPNNSLKEKLLKLYFYHNLQLLSFLLMYSFCKDFSATCLANFLATPILNADI